jgi:CBS domain-containing protein
MSFTIATGERRNISLPDLVNLLRSEAANRLDVIAGSGALRCQDALLVLEGTQPQLGPDGVTMTEGAYVFNDVALGQVADKLNVPAPYLRRVHREVPELFDTTFNMLMARTDRRFLVRAQRTPQPGTGLDALPGYGFDQPRSTDVLPAVSGRGGDGTIRALLSDRYHRLDSLDVLLAALEGIRAAGVNARIDGADLSDTRMSVRVVAPSVAIQAPILLRRYRSPFTGQAGAELPVVWAGFVLTNSEVGCGAFSIRPRIKVLACGNGLVIPVEGMRRTHLGARHDGDDGVVAWSESTTAKTLELITSKTADAVAAYLDVDYVTRMVRDLEAVAGVPVTDPDTTLKIIGQRLRVPDAAMAAVLAHFVAGGDATAGGVMHALTSVAQTLPDPDAAHDLEAVAIQAMHLAAAA